MDPSLQSSCQRILDTMPATENPMVFGAREDPRSFIGLPYSLRSGTQVLFPISRLVFVVAC